VTTTHMATAENVRSSLDEALAGFDPEANDAVATGRDYLQRLAAGGWAVPAWPSDLGGRGAGPEEAAEIEEALGQQPRPDLGPYAGGLVLAGPLLLMHGTRAQQERWVPGIARGDTIWCQLFSEPGAGSDIAGLTTSAVRQGDDWVLNGQKVWTSRAHLADFGICLTRTNPSAPKHRGITMFVVDMHAPGVTIRPLTQMTGDAEFNEVFLDGVVVPDAHRIGAVDDGWAMTLATLSFERATTIQREPAADPLRIPDWLAALARDGSLDDPVLADEAMRAYALGVAAACADVLMHERQAAGLPGAEGSGGKLRHSAVYKAAARVSHEASGLHALTQGEHSWRILLAPSKSIRGGTDEIQRNILSERVLRLPKDPAAPAPRPTTEEKP